jgi:hypothetical protein
MADIQDHRSFTIRIPSPMYIQIADMASQDRTSINQKVHQLLQIGLNGHVSLDEAVRTLLMGISIATPTENKM